MTLSDKQEFLRELDATDEGFVRRKLAIGGYTALQTRIVREWLGTKDAVRVSNLMTADIQARRQAMFWTRVVGAASVLLAIAALGEWFQ